MNLPELFQEKMKSILGEEYGDFLNCFDRPRQFGLRVNTFKISVEEFQRLSSFHLTPIPWVENGFYYEETDAPSRHPHYFAGLYYMQEPSAMTPASRLPVYPGERVLDLCAAPGGKATELGARLCGQGVLVANDISRPRTKALLKNLEIMGIPNIFVTNEVPAKLSERLPGFFDKILVDAPCSGEGMFRKNPDAVKEWNPAKPSECAKSQREILRRAVELLREGGMLLYSTCTFSPEENEQMIAWLLENFPQMELVPMAWYEGFSHGMPGLADGNPELAKCARIWPHRMEGEGHFAALLRKKGQGTKREACKKNAPFGASKSEWKILHDFLRDVRRLFAPACVQVRSGKVFYVPEDTQDVQGLVFLRNGLYMGELKKGRFEPSQALAMNLKKEEYASCVDFSSDDERVVRYLRGETVDADGAQPARGSGWQLVCVDGYPLGWGKLVGGLLKNKYLAGWRYPS